MKKKNIKSISDQIQIQTTLYEYVSDAIILADLSFQIMQWNKAAEKIYGFKENEVLGKNINDIVKTEYIISDSEFINEDFFRVGSWQGEVVQFKKDLTPIQILSSISLVRDSSEAPLAILALNRDISAQIQAEKILQQQSWQLQKRLKELSLLHKLARYSTEANWKLEDVFLECLMIIPPSWQYPEKTYCRIVYDGNPYILSSFHEGKHFLSAEIAVGGEIRGVIEVHVNLDITKVKEVFLKEERDLIQSIAKLLGEFGRRFQVERALKASEEYLRSTLESLDDLVLVMDEEGNFQTIFPFVSQNLWISPEELLNRPYSEVLPEHVVGLFNASIQTIQKADIVQEFDYPMMIENQETWFNARLSSRKNHDGEYSGIIIVLRNITEQKKTEEDIKLLNTVLNHDLVNKLHIIEGAISLLKKTELPKKVNNLVDMALNASREGKNLIHKISLLENLFQTIKADNDFLPQIQLVDVVKDVIKEHTARASELGIDIIDELKEIDFKIITDSLLREAFSNILDNSIHHSKGSIIKIWIQKDCDYISLIIEDNGKGISDDSKERIFQKGYKGKESTGSGFGLFLVQSIVQNYQGEILVEDSDMGGARFIIRFEITK